MAKPLVSRLFPAGLRKNSGGGGGENNIGVYEQEYVAEEETNEEESQVDYNEVEEDSSVFRGDYAEEEDSDYSEEQHEESDEYNGVEEEEEEEEIEEEEEEEQNHEQEHQDSVTLTNHDFLDCPICYKPLDVPVFQCGNGHVACSSCCYKINYLCAYCRHPIDTRNRLIEEVLESARAKCKNTKYGCKETMNYKKIHEHEMTCLHEPCSCLVSDCNFVGTTSQLYKHFSIKHKDSAILFSYNSPFHMTLNPDDRSFILQEEADKFLFVLNNFSESYGNAISVSRIVSKTDECLILDYDIEARDSSFGIHSQKFQSVTLGCQKLDAKPPSTGFLIVPSYLFSYNGQVELDICIWRSVTSRKRKHS